MEVMTWNMEVVYLSLAVFAAQGKNSFPFHKLKRCAERSAPFSFSNWNTYEAISHVCSPWARSACVPGTHACTTRMLSCW